MSFREKILVNRGWVSFRQKNPKTREEGQVKGEVEITGVIRNSEGTPSFGPGKKEDVRIWFYRYIFTLNCYIINIIMYLIHP